MKQQHSRDIQIYAIRLLQWCSFLYIFLTSNQLSLPAFVQLPRCAIGIIFQKIHLGKGIGKPQHNKPTEQFPTSRTSGENYRKTWFALKQQGQVSGKYDSNKLFNSETWIKGIFGGIPFLNHHVGWPLLRSLEFVQEVEEKKTIHNFWIFLVSWYLIISCPCLWRTTPQHRLIQWTLHEIHMCFVSKPQLYRMLSKKQ